MGHMGAEAGIRGEYQASPTGGLSCAPSCSFCTPGCAWGCAWRCAWGWVTPARAPYISAPEITKNFLEIFWRLFGLPRGGLRGWMRVLGILLRGCSGIFWASSEYPELSSGYLRNKILEESEENPQKSEQ